MFEINDRVKVVPVGGDPPGQYTNKTGIVKDKDVEIYAVLLDGYKYLLGFMSESLVLKG